MTEEIIKKLGPLSVLAGTWGGEKGNDDAPSPDRKKQTRKYREQIIGEPLGPINNHEQELYGLRYSRAVWRIDNDQPFHEDLGYLLWDSAEKQVLRCFVIPRGVAINAGGTVEPDAREFTLTADVGSMTYGVSSNKFLDREFKTIKFVHKIFIHDENSFSYEETTYLQIKGQKEVFNHVDKNTLVKLKMDVSTFDDVKANI
jgi:hypothetical protein|tara:strand:- start:126 stop:728 length:603 start_codon:yes stop_codon:yes gene_type:complete